MQRTCDVCGEPYEAQRATSRSCSKRCRVRKSRSRSAAASSAPAPVPPGVTASAGSLAELTRAELAAVGREGTAKGLLAVLLARRLDAATREPGMGMAALSRQYDVALESAVRGAAAASDPVDELRARRDRKRAG